MLPYCATSIPESKANIECKSAEQWIGVQLRMILGHYCHYSLFGEQWRFVKRSLGLPSMSHEL